MRTVREDGPRLIGNVAIEVSLDDGGGRACWPGSRTTAGARTWARASSRSGACCADTATTGAAACEGARSANTIGTYLHGPLLPKNVWFADWLIARALGIDAGELAPLDDAIERQTHLSARRAAGV